MTTDPGDRNSHPLESLTLARLCGRFLRQPGRTLCALWQILSAPPDDAAPPPPAESPAVARNRSRARTLPTAVTWSLALRLLSLALAVQGNHLLLAQPSRAATALPVPDALLLLLALALWLLADGLYPWPRRLAQERVLSFPACPVAATVSRRQRLLAALAGALCCWLAWRLTAGNRFTLVGVSAWLLSVALCYRALTPGSLNLRARLRNLRHPPARARLRRPEMLTLLLILLLAAGLRLQWLDSVMPEMTSDHVEKIRDAWRVSQGEFDVFFTNNGGREPLQMYLMALLAQQPGQGFNFTTLKLLSALEGIFAVLLLYWMGRELIGGRTERLTGLLLAAFVAVSYWHLVLSRLGLRIVLTTAVTALLLLLLWRALRHNRRADFLAAGLLTGFSLYTYQAARMLPLVIAAGVALSLLSRAAAQRSSLLRNSAALALMALVVAVPLAGYALEFPQDFWRRAASRMLGDEVITGDTESAADWSATAGVNAAQLAQNLRDALLMFNWKGDIAWINGAPGAPALDPWTGALFVTGLAAWARRVQRKRSLTALLLPLSLLIMLLPTVLALAFPIENPSHTRASGALPAVFLIASLPAAQLVTLLRYRLRGRAGRLAAAALTLLLLSGTLHASHQRYFVDNLRAWQQATFPYSTAGQVLAAFIAVTDAPGNAFVIAWPHWWDHRAVGIEAGLQAWPNGVPGIGELPGFMSQALTRTGTYRPDPQRDLLFFLAPADERALAQLQGWFPRGHMQQRHSEHPRDEFLLYRVPAVGEEALRQWADEAS